jgi:hypothetical protein
VFREHIQKADLATTQELDTIFSNITDIAELTMNLIGSLEDTLEMAEDGQITAIGESHYLVHTNKYATVI